MGCGIGCGVIILVAVVLGVSAVLYTKNMMKGFDEAITTRQELVAQYGQVREFVPAPDGSIPADRMQVFLAVRDSLGPQRELITATFESFAVAGREIEAETSGFKKFIRGLQIGKSGLGVGRDLGEFYQIRNRVLLESGMGLGEYTYIYVLGYYSLLGHAPDDGPDKVFEEFEAEHRDDEGPHWQTSLEDDEDPFPRIRRDLIAMLKNQLAALPPEGEDPALESWRQELAAEIAALDDDPQRGIWPDGLPAAIQTSLEPYRDRLEASYSPVLNVLELSRNRRQGWSIKGE